MKSKGLVSVIVECYQQQTTRNVTQSITYSATQNIMYSIVCVYIYIRLRLSRSSVLAFGTQVRGFKPGRSRRNFKGESSARLPSEGK